MKLLPQAGSNTFVSNSFFIFLIRFFPTLANLFIVIFFSRLLDKDSYGLYQHFWVQLYFISALACLGVQSLVVTYQPALIARLVKSFSVRSFAGYGIWLLVLAAIFAILQTDDTSTIIAFAMLLAYSLSIVIESLLTAFRRFTFLAIINFIYTVVFLLLHWLLVEYHWSVIQMLGYILAITVIKLAITSLSLNSALRNQEEYTGSYSLESIRRLWMHIGVYDVSQTLFRWIDKFVISFLFAKEIMAIYYNGSLEIPFLPILLGAAGSAALMKLSTPESDAGQTADLMKRSGRLLSAIVFPIFFFFLVFRQELFGVVLSGNYPSSIPIFAMAVLAMPLRAYSFTTVLQNRHRGDIMNIGAVGDMIIACALMYPLYQVLGLPGIALSFVISRYLQAVYYLWHSARELDTNISALLPLKNWIAKLILFSCAFIGFYYLVADSYSEEIVLALGCVLTGTAVCIAFFLELRTERKTHGAA